MKIFFQFTCTRKRKKVSYVPGVFEIPALLSDNYCSAVGTSGSYSTIQFKLETLGVSKNSFEITDCEIVLKRPPPMNNL